MTSIELNRQYSNYLETVAEKPQNLYFRGLLHGLGIALGYDYETVELDIAKARHEPMHGQIRLAI